MKPPTRPALPSWSIWVLVFGLLGLNYALAIGSKRNHSTTSDEIAHLTAGYAYWRLGDYRMHPENGNLPQRWAALPAVLAGAKPPSVESEAWRKSDIWMFGHEFFYGIGNDHERWLLAGRAMIGLFLAGTGLLAFLWSRRLWGTTGALVTLGFYAFCPNFLAHGALITSDMCMVFFFLATVGAYWRHLHTGTWTSGAVSAGVFGLACVAKFSAALILPMMVIMAAARACHPEPLRLGGRVYHGRGAKFGALAASTLVQGLVAMAVIWIFYGLRYSAFNPELPAAENFSRPWDWICGRIGFQGDVVNAMAAGRLLPQGYLYGYAYTIESCITRGSFLDGAYSDFGWISFFPKAFLYKTPDALLLVLALGLALAAVRIVRQPPPRLAAFGPQLYQLTPLLTLFIVYWAFSLSTNLNIGHRHILPTYPVLFILLGGLGWLLTQDRMQRPTGRLALAGLTGGLWLWFAADTVRAYPHYLAYFNRVSGGPENGYRHLVDSSLDWGQDLPTLKQWLDANQRPGEPVYLAYFGTSKPAFYGINATRMPTLHEFNEITPWYWPEPGLYALSATMLQHVYLPYRGPWTPAREQEYQLLRRLDPYFRALKADPYGHPDLLREITPLGWSAKWYQYEQLRFARLCQYLRARRPDAMAGYSILIYRLTQEEVDAALNGPASRLESAIAQALAAP
ncbi:MAG: glycosyltransferase family 39 protein [Opitutaceae bacterium]|nr:glycosyltransferase family 39 protein [Opitutaceae bacterium]